MKRSLKTSLLMALVSEPQKKTSDGKRSRKNLRLRQQIRREEKVHHLLKRSEV